MKKIEFQKFNYPTMVTAMAFVSVAFVTISHYPRVLPKMQNWFLLTRLYIAVVLLLLVIRFTKKPFSDLYGAVFCLHLMAYVLMMLWFMPLYELAYLQCAIGAAFLNFKRPWIFPAIFGSTLLAFPMTYSIQSSLSWTLPSPKSEDFISSMTISFLLAWTVQKFAIGAFRKETDKLLRFSVIGQETTKLVHDLKGMLSSPLIILDTLKNKDLTSNQEFYIKQMNYLIADMDNVRTAIKGINRLASTNDTISEVSVRVSLESAQKILSRRLQNIEITLPVDRKILANADLLNSVFFNLLINSIEAFESNQRSEGKIEIYWEGDNLCIRDNAGKKKASELKDSPSLGLTLAQNDLAKINSKLTVNFGAHETIATIHFAKSSLKST